MSRVMMGPLENPVDEAIRIIDAAEKSGTTLRLFGGVAFYLRCPSANHLSLRRRYVDVDFMGHAKQTREIKRLFEEMGYSPRERFNAVQGFHRLIFNDIGHQRRADVFLDVFEMCHRFYLKDRIGLNRMTIPLADLMATKLQIVEVNEKDVKDMQGLMLDHEVGTDDSPELVNGGYLARLCSDDWGVYRTFTLNLERLQAVTQRSGLGDSEKRVIISRIGRLSTMIEETPKSLKWKMRAALGEKVRWYELPEGDQEVVDSRVPARGNLNAGSL